jgi:hypothetical protein
MVVASVMEDLLEEVVLDQLADYVNLSIGRNADEKHTS